MQKQNGSFIEISLGHKMAGTDMNMSHLFQFPSFPASPLALASIDPPSPIQSTAYSILSLLLAAILGCPNKICLGGVAMKEGGLEW